MYPKTRTLIIHILSHKAMTNKGARTSSFFDRFTENRSLQLARVKIVVVLNSKTWEIREGNRIPF